jgi:hypothetical protein
MGRHPGRHGRAEVEKLGVPTNRHRVSCPAAGASVGGRTRGAHALRSQTSPGELEIAGKGRPNAGYTNRPLEMLEAMVQELWNARV